MPASRCAFLKRVKQGTHVDLTSLDSEYLIKQAFGFDQNEVIARMLEMRVKKCVANFSQLSIQFGCHSLSFDNAHFSWAYTMFYHDFYGAT